MRRKNKYAMIDDYISLFRIIYTCKISEVTNDDQNYFESQNITLTNLQNLALDLKDKYENLFQKLKICDISFILLKSQLNEAINNNLRPTKLQKIATEKLNNLNIQLKQLDDNHNSHILKIK